MSITIRSPRFLIVAVLATLAWPSLCAETKIDEDKIYYGDIEKYNNPAVVDAAEVYRQIPAHQELVRRKLTREDPDYWPLMRKASQIFVRALRKACQKKGHDLVGEVDSITMDGGEIPEITSEVIRILKKAQEKSKSKSKENSTP